MYINKTKLHVNDSYVGESIEEKIAKAMNNKEPIDSTAPLIYTERKDGVLPGYDPRTDRFDIALEAQDKVNKMLTAQREEAIKSEQNPTPTDKNE